jgi:hypothetical protein
MPHKTLFLLTTLLGLTAWGVGRGQTPAPAPRPVVPPRVEMASKHGRVEVRWATTYASFTASATQVTVADGVLSLSGTDDEPVVVTMQTERPVATPADWTVTVDGGFTVRRMAVSLRDAALTFPKNP